MLSIKSALPLPSLIPFVDTCDAEIVPSSARSTASPAIQLPEHLVPLLAAPLNRLKTAVNAALPPSKTQTALEEAEFEEEESAGFGQHFMMQCLSSIYL